MWGALVNDYWLLIARLLKGVRLVSFYPDRVMIHSYQSWYLLLLCRGLLSLPAAPLPAPHPRSYIMPDLLICDPYITLYQINRSILQWRRGDIRHMTMELIFSLYIKLPGRHQHDIMMEWPIKDSAMASSQEKHPAELGNYPPGCNICTAPMADIWCCVLNS